MDSKRENSANWRHSYINKRRPLLCLLDAIKIVGVLHNTVSWGLMSRFNLWLLIRSFDIRQGTRQGSICSPFLYTVFIDGLQHCRSNSVHGTSINNIRPCIQTQTGDIELITYKTRTTLTTHNSQTIFFELVVFILCVQMRSLSSQPAMAVRGNYDIGI